MQKALLCLRKDYVPLVLRSEHGRNEMNNKKVLGDFFSLYRIRLIVFFYRGFFFLVIWYFVVKEILFNDNIILLYIYCTTNWIKSTSWFSASVGLSQVHFKIPAIVRKHFWTSFNYGWCFAGENILHIRHSLCKSL